MRYFCILAVGVFFLAACKDSDSSSCTKNEECPAGHVCANGRCSKVCNTDQDCVGGLGYICENKICQPGQRAAPQIETVFGNGSMSCPALTDGRCFANGLIVQGENLLGSGAILESDLGGPSVILTPGEEITEHRLAANFPADLTEGLYRLVLTNAAGEAQADVLILQGEPGPDLTGQQLVERINADATGTFALTRLPVGTGSDQVARGDHTHPGGSQILHAQATPGSHSNPVAIIGDDFVALKQACGEPTGCSIAIGNRYFEDPNYGLCNSVRWGPPCRLHIDANNYWAISPWCLLGNTPYSSWSFEQDNNNVSKTVLLASVTVNSTAYGVCTLSEGAGPTGADNQAGFYFWMEAETAQGAFDHASRTCELLIGP